MARHAAFRGLLEIHRLHGQTHRISETSIRVQIYLADQETAKALAGKLEKSAEDNEHDLTRTIDALSSIKGTPEGEITIEEIERKKETVILHCYAGRVGPPTWFIGALHELGARLVSSREWGDEGGMTHYFVEGKNTNKEEFDAAGGATP